MVLVDRVLRTFEQAEKPRRQFSMATCTERTARCRESERADAVDEVHRQVDDRHLQRAIRIIIWIVSPTAIAKNTIRMTSTSVDSARPALGGISR